MLLLAVLLLSEHLELPFSNHEKVASWLILLKYQLLAAVCHSFCELGYLSKEVEGNLFEDLYLLDLLNTVLCFYAACMTPHF